MFYVPVVTSIAESRGAARAFFVFPTKALAQDQCRALRSVLHASDSLDFIRVRTCTTALAGERPTSA